MRMLLRWSSSIEEIIKMNQCFISIPPEIIRKTGFIMFPQGVEMEHWLKMGQ